MIVYVESNFLLELAFLRGEHQDCGFLLELAQAQKITLVLPAFSISESYMVWGGNRNRRTELGSRLGAELKELSRSQPYQELSTKFQDLTTRLISTVDEEKQQLNETLNKVLNIAEVIPIGVDIIQSAIDLQKSRNLFPQDSIIYGSILGHLTKAPPGKHWFITRDRHFANPEITNDLDAYGCRLLTSFSHGLQIIRSQI